VASLVALEVDVVISMDNDDILNETERNGTEWNPIIIVYYILLNLYFNLIYLAFVSI
jgi:hypothetical protein